MVYMRKLNTRKENINESAGILVAIKGWVRDAVVYLWCLRLYRIRWFWDFGF
jgi:hypothetical protein